LAPAPRYTLHMPDDAFADTLTTVAAGRAAAVAELQRSPIASPRSRSTPSPRS
jgi:hypothetical protein